MSLTDQARAEAAGTVATTTETPPKMGELLQRMAPEFQKAMPRGAEAQQLIRDAVTCISRIPKLKECDSESFLGALMTCAQLGLRPGVLGQAWVLPFWDSKARSNRAQLVIGYQGMTELAYRSDRVASIVARTVHAKDEFAVEYGTEDSITHIPNRDAALDGDNPPTDYYVVVKTTNGGRLFWTMTHAQMEAHRDAHASARTKDGRIVGPWKDHFEAMAHKTCLLKLARWMPRSPELNRGLAADEGIRLDASPTRQPEEATTRVEQVVTQDGDPVAQNAPTDPEEVPCTCLTVETSDGPILRQDPDCPTHGVNPTR